MGLGSREWSSKGGEGHGDPRGETRLGEAEQGQAVPEAVTQGLQHP